MKKCKSCARIIKDEKLDIYCANCVRSDGSLKSYDEVWGSLAKFLRETQNLDVGASENAAKAIVSSQPAWEKKHGVYFEEDMKKSRRLVISLVVAISLILVGIGIGFWGNIVGSSTDYYLFESNEEYEITEKVGDVEFHSLQIDGEQTNPKFRDDKLFFLSDRKGRACFPHMLVGGFCTQEDSMDDLYCIDIQSCDGVRLFDMPGYSIDSAIQGGYMLYDDNMIVSFENHDDVGDRFVYYTTHQETFIDYILHGGNPQNIDPGSSGVDCLILGTSEPYSVLKIEADNSIPRTYITGDYLAWSVYSSEKNESKIFIKNLNSEKEVQICDSAILRSIAVTDEKVFWKDNRNISSEFPEIYCYDIKTGEEYIVFEGRDARVFSVNDSHVLIWMYNEDKYYIWDMKSKTGKYLNLSIFPKTYLSLSRDGTDAAWIDKDSTKIQIGNTSNLAITIGVSYFDKEIISEEIHYLNSDFILWTGTVKGESEMNLFVTKLTDSSTGAYNDTILLDKIPSEYKDFYVDFKISDGYICWERYTETGTDICWVKLSEIFPE